MGRWFCGKKIILQSIKIKAISCHDIYRCMKKKDVFSSGIISSHCLQRFLWVGNSSYEWAIFEMCYFSVNNQRDSMGMKSSQEVFGTCCCCCCCCRATALKQQSGKAERRMIFRCQNLRWRTNTRLRILHPHDQFKSLLECGV